MQQDIRNIRQKTTGGFTLVELAVVMMAIGLIIGGVLKGQELVTNARIASTVTQIHEMSTAVVAFQEIYGQLPGDLRSADRSVPGCVAPCGAGNGDGIIGLSNDRSQGGMFSAIMSQAGTTNQPEVETTWFWQHLMLTGLITGVEVSDPAYPSWGVTHPASDLPGGLHVAYLATGQPLDYKTISGHYIAFRAHMHYLPGGVTSIGNIATEYKEGTTAVTPFIAQNIDRKMDDGKALAGYVMSPSLNGLGCAPAYDLTTSARNCMLTARITG